nr:EAL domain-containing protein [Alteromonas hispanica]
MSESFSAKAIELSDLQFTELNKRQGLSDTAVLDIVEDDMGFIWIATSNGLNRYSGYEVKQYHPSDIDPNSIPSGFVQTLFLDSAGTLWAGTNSGLAMYRAETDDFKVFNQENSIIKSNYITAISESKTGNILFADGKFLYQYDPHIEKVVSAMQIFDDRTFVKVIMDEVNRTWVGSNTSGARVIDNETDEISNLNKVNPWGINLGSTALHDIKIINGNYWLATKEGLRVVNVNGKTILKTDGSSLGFDGNLNSLSIEVIGKDVWLGTASGLFILNNAADSDIEPETKFKVLHLNSANFETTGFPNAITLQIMMDRTGGVWVATFHQGVFRYHPEYASVHFQAVYNSNRQAEDNFATVWALAENLSEELLLVTQQRGLAKFNKKSGDISYLKYSDNEPPPSNYWDLAIDSSGYYWLASSDGLIAYEEKNGVIKKVAHLFKGDIIDHIHYHNDIIWVWHEVLGPAYIEANALTNPSKKLTARKLDIEGLEQTLVPIYSDSQNRLWLRNDKGLIIVSITSKEVIKKISKQTSLNSKVYAIYETSEAFWLTTRSDGVLMVDKSSFDIIKRQERDDSNGYIISSAGVGSSIWYADAIGVHQIALPSLKKESVIPYSELNYNSLGESSVFVSADQSIYFGGSKGYNKISKKATSAYRLSSQTTLPQLDKLRVFGATKVIDKKQVAESNDSQSYALSQDIRLFNKLILTHDETRFSISFALINPVYPSQIEYRYKLSKQDLGWIYIEDNRVAQFNNIGFGNYTFEVQAKEPGKNWSESRTLNIEIERPPWLHAVALVFYALITIVIITFLVRQLQIRKANQLAIKESEERLKLTLWSSGDELWDWDVYRGQVYRANTWGTLDFPQDDIRTTGAYDANIHPNDLSRVKEALTSHLEGNTDYYELAYRAKTFKNQWIWILDRGKVVERDHNEQPIRMTGTLKNIHHLKEAEEQLNLFKRSIENISEGVFISNTKFKFISVNNAYCGYTGETRDQALASYMHFHLYPDAFTEEIKKTLRTKGNWSGEVESVRMNGDRFEIELNIDAVHDEDGKISHFVGVFSDITSRKNTEKELLKLANTDPLTELPNRSFFQASHQNLVRKGEQHALLCLDMDNFKKINDSLGHQTGDILIKQIAKRLQRITGKNATCYRLGGDEFSILMENNADIHTVTHCAQNVLDTLSRPFIINKQEFVLGASIGIAFFPDDGLSPQEMLKNADTAMYFAKNNGGNSYQFFSGEMNQNAVRQLQIENLIRQGIKDDLFTVYYQPKVDITSGKLVSMEALVRFEHPQKGIVSPGQFIPLAEQTGQIIEIGEQVLRKACADTKRWVSQGLFTGRVAVNISAKQFELPDLDERINRILSDVGLSPLHLECEITEGTLMESPENGLQMMMRLRERGIHLALDDFGTGYSSLAYLKRFPLNTLKIDKAFIDDIAKSNVDRHMAAAIINIAHNLGLKVVAEGVEEEAQLNILRRYDCEMLQGFLYSKPLNAERFEKLLTENQQLNSILGNTSLQ